MCRAIRRLRSPGEIGHWSRQYVQISQNRRREEDEPQRNTILAKFITRVRRHDGASCLQHRRNFVGAESHKTVRLVIDAHDTSNWLSAAGPVRGVRVGEIIRGGPDAEIWVVRDERGCRRPLLSASRQEAETQHGIHGK